MRVKDLLEEIQRCKEQYGDNFLEWNIFTEQICSEDKEIKKGTGFGGNWRWLKDSEDWEYIECAGFWTKFEKERVFTINVNY